MEETGASQKLTSLNVGAYHVFDPGEEQQHIAMNLVGAESSLVGVGCWSSRLEQRCLDQQLGRAVLGDGLHLQSGRCCVD